MPSQDEVDDQLRILDSSIRQCKSCPEREQFPGTLPTVQFRSQNGTLFVGREPAKDGWRRSGKAFYKEDGSLLSSGRILKTQLEGVGLDIEEINFVELIKCFPSGNKTRNPWKSEIENCRHWLDRQMDIISLVPRSLSQWERIAMSSFVGTG
jgi:uracil-DNA glycosylase family 4